MNNEEPLRKRFAKAISKPVAGTVFCLASVVGVPILSGVGLYDVVRDAETAEWNYETFGDREKNLSDISASFNGLQSQKTLLDTASDVRKHSYSLGADAIAEASRIMVVQQKQLEQNTTTYVENLITSHGIHEKDYYELGQEFLNSDLVEYSETKPRVNYFEASHRMECHLDLANEGQEVSAYNTNECMDDAVDYGVGHKSEMAGVITGATLFTIFLMYSIFSGEEKLEEWKKLPNKPKDKNSKKKNWLPRRRKMKEN